MASFMGTLHRILFKISGQLKQKGKENIYG